ncbi:peroxisome membrane protein [Cladochytrium replicatum]|nr:peroxisome membrane protein [Cladochytrium replicatum]
MPSFNVKYERVVRENAPQIGAIESTLRSISYVLPGRFEGSEIVSEGLFTLVNTFGAYHDAILGPIAAAQAESTPNGPPKDATSAFNRYTRGALKSSSLYARVAYTLTIVQFFEVLLEMTATRARGRRAKWRVVTVLEVIKLACRSALFSLSRRRMLLHAAVPERDYEISQLKPQSDVEANEVPRWTGRRSGKEHPSIQKILSAKTGKGDVDIDPLQILLSGKLPSIPPSDPSVAFLVSKALVEATPNASDLLKSLSNIRLFAEWVFILRPFIYIIALHKYGRKSWTPWALSLGLESASFALGALDPTKGFLGFRKDLSRLESAEYVRRLYLFGYYLLRQPFYDGFTRERLDGFITATSGKPLISIISAVLKDYQPLWEEYYFYTSGF